jgi:hypothetical protein
MNSEHESAYSERSDVGAVHCSSVFVGEGFAG